MRRRGACTGEGCRGSVVPIAILPLARSIWPLCQGQPDALMTNTGIGHD
jgi:hypothetical protein